MRRVYPRAATALPIAAALLLAGCSGRLAPPPLTLSPPVPPFPAPPPSEPATPAAVRAEIARWFAAKGYRDFQVAALVEHARIESGFQPCAAGAAGLRYTYQWGGTRLQRLYRLAGERRCPPLDRQLEFADRELRSEPNFACFWRTTTTAAAVAALRRGFGRGRC